MKTIITISYILFFISTQLHGAQNNETRKIILNPINCELTVPSHWHIKDNSSKSIFSWTVSHENPDVGPYRTGATIHVTPNIKKLTGLSAEQHAQQLYKHKRESFELRNLANSKQGIFNVTSFRTSEMYSERVDYTEYEYRYALYWSNDMDLLLIIIAKTPLKNSSEFDAVLNTINSFKFKDFSYFK